MFDYQDKLTFSKAIFYNFNPIPLPRTFKDATGGFGNFAPLQGWVQIFDSEGYCGETFCSKGLVENVLPLILTGETKTYKEWYNHIYWSFRNFGFQSGQICDLGQFDLIMLDILARRQNKPLHRFLGAKKDWASVYKGGGAIISEDQQLVEDMVRYVEEGYRTIKFKVGSDWGQNMERDVRRMELVRKAVGDDVAVAVDGNQVWSVDEALKFADLIRPYNPAWFEEPVHSHDMGAIQQLKERGINMKIAFGESMRNYYVFETYVEKGVDHLMPLAGRMGSMRELVAIRDLAKSKGLDFSSGGTTFVNAALGALYEENEMLEYHEPITFTLGECLEVKSEERDGRFYLPDIEGAPLRINLKKLEAEGALESMKYYYSESAKLNFAVRAAY